jgi:hypothetical protein
MNGQNYPMTSRAPLRQRPLGSALTAFLLILPRIYVFQVDYQVDKMGEQS